MDLKIFEYQDFRNWFKRYNSALLMSVNEKFTQEQAKELLFAINSFVNDHKQIVSTEPAAQVEEFLQGALEEVKDFEPGLYPADPKVQEALLELATHIWERVEAEKNGETIDPVQETKNNLPEVTSTVLNYEGEANPPRIDEAKARNLWPSSRK